MKKVITLLFLMPLAACGPNKNPTLIHSGTDDASIVGGQVVDKEIFAKHVVAIYNSKEGVLCTGTLIANNLVLTAAHCANTGVPSEYAIFFTKNPKVNQSLVRHVTNIRVHAYNPKSYADRKDLAILRFDGYPPAGFEPMPLPTEQDLADAGRTFYATGYGTVTGRKDITERQGGTLRYTQVTINEPEITTATSQFSVSQQNGHGICFGDSGGPAFAKIDDRRVVMGVASAVYSLDQEARKKPDFDICRYQAIYISTYFHLPWIQKTAAELAVY
ncbi:S1 family peptidase [Bdellovibrio sp. HCB337]|uniref:S1 family peptidase n=1 Tax=Bdellovibrio sp. HCB337 TaxID=3394358 RepID=UPI0039A759B6